MKNLPNILIISLVALPFSIASAKENTLTSTKKLSGIELYTQSQRQNSFEACTHLFPHTDPEFTIQPTYINSAKWLLRRLCSNDFAVLYSDTTKTPLLVIEKLDARGLNISVKREDDFFPDPRTPTKHRATLADYKGLTNIDRGHLAPAADAVSPIGMAQTFALSNMVPQDSNNNRNAWKKIESDVRKYVLRSQGDVYVVTGVLFSGQITKIGKNQIWKPSHLFKVVYHPNQNKSWAYVIKNQPNQPIHQISYQQFSKSTGIKLGYLEPDFNLQSSNISTIVAGLGTGALTQKATEHLSKNLDHLGSNTDSIWDSIKYKISTIWNSILEKIITWLKDNDQNRE